MSRPPTLLIAVLLLLVPTTFVRAQDDSLPNRFVVPDDNLMIYYPHGWNVTYDPDDGTVYIASSVTGIVADWLLPDELARAGVAPGDAVAALEYFFNPLDPTVVFDPARVGNRMVDGHTLYIYEYEDAYQGAPYDGVLAVSEASDGSFFAGDIFGLETASVDANDVQEALRIVAGVQFPETGASETVVTENLFPLLESGIGVVLPEGWSDVVDEDGFLTLESDYTVLEPRWYFADELAELGLDAGDVPGVLADFAGRQALDLDPRSVSASLSGGRSVWRTTFQFEDRAGEYEALLAGVLLDDGSVLIAFAYPSEGSALDERVDVLAILASAQLVEAAGASEGVLLSESFTFDLDGVTFSYPADWSLELDEDFVYLASDLTYIDPYYTLVEDLASQGVAVGDLAGGLEALWWSLYESEGMIFDPAALETLTVEGQPLLLYRFEHSNDDTHEHWMTAVELEDGTQFYLDAYPAQGSALREGDLVLRVTVSAEIGASMPVSGEERIAIRLHRDH